METIKPRRIVRSRRRTVALVITPEATLEVRAPWRTPVRFIENFINEKSPWIRRKLLEASQRPPVKGRAFCDGENFLFLGKQYRLKTDGGLGAPVLTEEELRVPAGHPAIVRSALLRWYKIKAQALLEERTCFFRARVRSAFRSLRISDARSRWGSCGFKGTLNFSWRLVMAPLGVIDYVVAHELAHLEEKNHSRRFWAEVRRIFPEYEEHKAWLKENAALLNL